MKVLKTLTVLLTVLPFVFPHTDKTETDSTRLSYLGKFASDQFHGLREKRSSTAQQSFYFFSQNAAGWATATGDCKAFLGSSASLLYIETLEELNNITRFIKSRDDIGSLYWSGGRFDSIQGKFVWNNGAEIGPWTPWRKGHPNSNVSVTRLAAYTVGNVEFQTHFDTESIRFICELKSDLSDELEEALPCYRNNDLVIVLDSSGSIGEEHYPLALEFTVRLATAWVDNTGSRVSFITYSSSAHTVLSLEDKPSLNHFREMIYNTPYLKGGTASHMGLDLALQQFQQSNRTDVYQNLLILTDGTSTFPNATNAAIERIHSAGINVFGVGIGNDLNREELLAITGYKNTHVFSTDGFDHLLKLLHTVSKRMCLQ